MNELALSVKDTLANYYEEMRTHVHQWAAPLTTEQIWTRPYPYGNSFGHLLLHLTGNLSYYVGAQIAGTGYVRHRDVEFTDAERRPKEQVLAEFDRAIQMVVDTIRKQSPEDWTKPFEAEREPTAKDRFTCFFRCAAHAYHHVGQMIFLSKEFTTTPRNKSGD